MHPAYFDTRFRIDMIPEQWPTQFVILSAWATTGQSWTEEANEAADRQLAHHLAERGLWHLRVAGYSPTTAHTEPSWAFPMAFSEACDLGQLLRQDALYYVEADQLSVTHCDHRRSLVAVGSFRRRLDAE